MRRLNERRKRRELNSMINIVPLLDILLVLLLIFITTETITTHNEIVVDLPYTTDSKLINKGNEYLKPVIIEVSGVGKYSVIIEKDRIDKFSPEQITVEIQKRIHLNPKAIFLIGGARNVPYSEIIKVLNLLNSAGIKSVGLMTKPI